MPRATIIRNPPEGLPAEPVLQSRAVIEMQYASSAAGGASGVETWRFAGSDGVRLYLWPDGSLLLDGPARALGTGPRVSRVESGDAILIRYVHQGNGLAYQHDFERRAVRVVRQPDELDRFIVRLMRSDGAALYRYFPELSR